MVQPLDPTAVGFLFAENHRMPMHVGGLQLFDKPEGAGRSFVQDLYAQLKSSDDIAPLFLKHPVRSVRTAGQWVWEYDDQFDIEYHVRHSALPKPGRVRELLELVSRLHSTRLATERPLWEWNLIEGLRDGRVAFYCKLHHSLLDGVAAMRLLQSMLSPDPTQTDMPAPWEIRPSTGKSRDAQERAETSLAELPVQAVRSALGIGAEAVGLPSALIRTLNKSVRNQTSALALYAPRTMFNQQITAARRFAAQGWPLERIRTVGKASGTTMNDVVLAMCSGAVRSYLLELEALPDSTLISMVPVGLKAKESHIASEKGGNAIGAVMVKLGTDRADPADRLQAVHQSMLDGKRALAAMTPTQIVAMSALGQAPAILGPMLKVSGVVKPPYNLIISNVPGPRTTQYFNGMRLAGTYPLSIPIDGMALNITCNSYVDQMAFGLTGCRRTVPHLQRLLTHLDSELGALEKATGL
ncbi:MAG: wax ester/triacylglycerol synthase family O-acyltransferase [Nocardioides sp.]|nr:wax ester/triacylglycerol synthase family O-acyltransferase [Nocardioides sp.]